MHLLTDTNTRALRWLHAVCEHAKCPSRPRPRPSSRLTLFKGVDFSTSLTRAHFEKLCQDLFHSSLKPVKVLRDAKINNLVQRARDCSRQWFDPYPLYRQARL